MLIYLAVPVRLLCSRYGMCLLVSRSMYSLASPKSAKKRPTSQLKHLPSKSTAEAFDSFCVALPSKFKCWRHECQAAAERTARETQKPNTLGTWSNLCMLTYNVYHFVLLGGATTNEEILRLNISVDEMSWVNKFYPMELQSEHEFISMCQGGCISSGVHANSWHLAYTGEETQWVRVILGLNYSIHSNQNRVKYLNKKC
jgi:hypothetical protein